MISIIAWFHLKDACLQELHEGTVSLALYTHGHCKREGFYSEAKGEHIESIKAQI